MSDITSHYILFQKPFTIKNSRVQALYMRLKDIAMDFTMSGKRVELDNCIGCAIGYHKIGENLQPRVDVYPNGTVSFCPYFETPKLHSHLSKEFITTRAQVCNQCSFVQ